MELNEMIAMALAPVDDKGCPFSEESVAAVPSAGESRQDDDAEPQGNNAGALGGNLEAGDADGGDGYAAKYPAPAMEPEPQIDTARQAAQGETLEIVLPAGGGSNDLRWPFTMAAHHLIPGNASLKSSAVEKFMIQGEKVGPGQRFTIEQHIGYNINGGHNGVWLPGSYAITDAALAEIASVASSKWSRYSKKHEEWAIHYIAAASRVGKGMFHNTHTKYSSVVRGMLNKIGAKLHTHLANCCDCKGKTKVPPPYRIKARLYLISSFLKVRTQAAPETWCCNLITFSKGWAGKIFDGRKPSKSFLDTYYSAKSYRG